MATYRLNNGLVEKVASPGKFVSDPVELVDVPATPSTVDVLVLDTTQAGLTPSNTLSDSTATNPTDDDFNQTVADIVTVLNDVVEALQNAGIVVSS